jgi:hypothetical protein
MAWTTDQKSKQDHAHVQPLKCMALFQLSSSSSRGT